MRKTNRKNRKPRAMIEVRKARELVRSLFQSLPFVLDEDADTTEIDWLEIVRVQEEACKLGLL